MKRNLTPIASGVALFLMGAALSVQAQEAADSNVQTVVTTGIRASLQQSLAQKKKAESHVEVITAEDIGKMPDKNVADSLSRVAGVTISSAGATEGGFDEKDRVSMRGTSPSLTQTTVNGHGLGSGDWFVLNQAGNSVGRSVSYSLLPSELVGSVVVHKSSEASLVEGGTAGNVDIITRRPISDFKKNLTIEGSLGVVYSDLPAKTDPQFNGLVNWKNDDKTMGVLVQAFYEKRNLRRDGQEVLGYDTVQAGNPVLTTNPDLLGVKYPRDIGSALFTQERKRKGGLIDFEIKPTNDLTLNFDAFDSKMDASNYNRNYLTPFNPWLLGNGVAPLPGYVIRNNTLVEASFAAPPSTGPGGGSTGLYDEISRPDASSSSNFFDAEAKWRVSDSLTLTGKLGSSKGTGETPTQDVVEMHTGAGSGVGWKINGLGAVDVTGGGDTSSPTGSAAGLDWIFGIQNQVANDKETYGQIDGVYTLGSGLFTELDFGARATKHDRDVLGSIAQGPLGSAFTSFPATFENYPSDFGSGLGGSFPRNIWFTPADVLGAYNAANTNRDPVIRAYPQNDSKVEEKTAAIYAEGKFKGEGYSGNVGLRYVRTTTASTTFVNGTGPAGVTTVTTSAFGPFYPSETDNDYNEVLPSLNLKFDLSKELVARLAINKTMTRPDLGALASGVSLVPPATITQVGTGTGPNPNLKPVTSNNIDTSLEYYFAPRAMVSLAGFYMDMTSYAGLGTTRQSFNTIGSFTPATGTVLPYDIVAPVNISARVAGGEFALSMPFGPNFGIDANFTYTNAVDSNGGPVVGASKNTSNLSGYFENDMFNARLTYNYRSEFFSGVDRASAFTQDGVATLAASLGYKISDNLTLTLDGQNLNNPKLQYFADNHDQPRSVYENGRQYYLMLHAKM